MIREAYFEHPLYVPLVQRAYALWSDLERQAARPLFLQTGGLMIGNEQGALVQGTLRSAIEHHLPHEVLSSGKLHRRYPAFAPLDDMVGVWEARAGILFPEEIVAAHLSLAQARGAEVRSNSAVQGWAPQGDAIALHLAGGEVVEAGQVVMAAGAWVGTLLHELKLRLTVERQIIHWFDPARFPEYHEPARMPVSIWQLGNGTLFYTKPDLGDGVKIGIHHGGQTVSPDSVDRRVSDFEAAAVYDLLRRFVPFAKGHPRDHAVCLYTNAPDNNFIVDRHPEEPRMIVISACSGHGFKFASVIGELTADLVTRGRSEFDLSPFSIARLTTPT